MERTSVWPWNMEEEAEWKADLEREDDILEQLSEAADEDNVASSSDALEEPTPDTAPEKYLVTT